MDKEEMIRQIVEILNGLTDTDVAQAYWEITENYGG